MGKEILLFCQQLQSGSCETIEIYPRSRICATLEKGEEREIQEVRKSRWSGLVGFESNTNYGKRGSAVCVNISIIIVIQCVVVVSHYTSMHVHIYACTGSGFGSAQYSGAMEFLSQRYLIVLVYFSFLPPFVYSFSHAVNLCFSFFIIPQ